MPTILAAHAAWAKSGRVPFVSALGRRWLARPFPAGARRRILIAYADYALATGQVYGFLHHRRRLARRGIHLRAIPATALDPAALPPRLDALLLQSTYEPPAGTLEAQLAALKAARPHLPVAFLDWLAPTDIRLAERVAPWVDHYMKKALLRDRSRYLALSRAETELVAWGADRYGLAVPQRSWETPPAILDRLIVGPAFSTAPALLPLFERAGQPPRTARPIDLHARIATKGSPTYQAMREEARDAVTAAFPDLHVASHGLIGKRAYMAELRASKICFSPFGYGEICWRDFEAIAAGAVLLKPDMSHIECDPDIYRPFETYLPVRWDLADLEERVRQALADPAGMRHMAERAFAVVRDHLRGPALERLIEHLSDPPADR